MGSADYLMIFENLGGYDLIEALQEHPNQDIYERAAGILKDFA